MSKLFGKLNSQFLKACGGGDTDAVRNILSGKSKRKIDVNVTDAKGVRRENFPALNFLLAECSLVIKMTGFSRRRLPAR